MKINRAGQSGLQVSDLTLGTMMWGRDTDADSAGEILAAFLDAGGTTIDTSCTYGAGAAEEIIGSLVRGRRRDEIVVVTKAGIRATPKGGMVDASRGTLLRNLDDSLARLGMSDVDVWLVGSPDPATPIDETLSALDAAVRSGRARYVGVSNTAGWQLAQAATLARHTTPLTICEAEYSLVQRGIEREVLPAADALGVGVLGWAALGRGVLTGKYRRTIPPDSRAASTHLAGFVEPYLDDRAAAIVDAVVVAADGLGVAPASVALAWLRSRVTSAIIGPRTVTQLTTLLDRLDVELPEGIEDALTDVSAPALGYPERRG